MARIRSRLPTAAFSSRKATVWSRTDGRSPRVSSPIWTPAARKEPRTTSFRIRLLWWWTRLSYHKTGSPYREPVFGSAFVGDLDLPDAAFVALGLQPLLLHALERIAEAVGMLAHVRALGLHHGDQVEGDRLVG